MIAWMVAGGGASAFQGFESEVYVVVPNRISCSHSMQLIIKPSIHQSE